MQSIVLNEDEKSDFFRHNAYQTCKKGNYIYNYKQEEILSFQDRLNVIKFSWVDMIFAMCLVAVTILITINYFVL